VHHSVKQSFSRTLIRPRGLQVVCEGKTYMAKSQYSMFSYIDVSLVFNLIFVVVDSEL